MWVEGYFDTTIENIRGQDRSRDVLIENMFNQIHGSPQVIAAGETSYKDGELAVSMKGTHALYSYFSWADNNKRSVPHEIKTGKPAAEGTADRVFLHRLNHVISWAYMLHMAWGMSGVGAEISLACLMRWGPEDILHSFMMWAIMMVL